MEAKEILVNSTFLQAQSIGLEDSSDCELHGPKKETEGFLGKRWFTCVECEAIRMSEATQETLDREDRDKQAKVDMLFRECQIGKRFQRIRFDSYEPPTENAKKAKKLCQEYALSFADKLDSGAGLIMVGRPGTGKNHLAAAICTEVMYKGHATIHTTVMKMIRRIKATWSRDSDMTEQRAIKSFCEPDLLIIDEVGVQFGSETEKLLLTEIINERYENIRPTIMLSNLPAKQLEDVLGERVVDRFRHGGEVLVFDWDSYRKSR